MESTTQIFLRVQKTEAEDSAVEGESIVGGYSYDDKRMQIDSFSFGMDAKLQSPLQSPKAGVSNLDFNPVQVTKAFDRASLRLAALLKGRKQLHEVRITVDQQLEDYADKEAGGKAQNAIIVFHLLNARLIDIKLDVSEDKAGATVKESLSFTFKKFEVEYYYKSMKSNKKSDYRNACRQFKSQREVQE